MAPAKLGSGDEAAELFHMLNPIIHTRTPADVDHYKAEPYVMAGDVCANPGHAGRGGWMYRAGLESTLGLRRHGTTFEIDPCIPASWPEYEIIWRINQTRHEITVSNPHRRCRGIAEAQLDGTPVDLNTTPRLDDAATHHLCGQSWVTSCSWRSCSGRAAAAICASRWAKSGRVKRRTACSIRKKISQRSSGRSPVILEILASIFGPISSPSWNAKMTSFQPGLSNTLCEPICRLMVQPIRLSPERTRSALVAASGSCRPKRDCQ